MSSPMPSQHKLEANREPVAFLLNEFNAVIKYFNARGKHGFAEYLIEQVAFSDEFAVPIEREVSHGG